MTDNPDLKILEAAKKAAAEKVQKSPTAANLAALEKAVRMLDEWQNGKRATPPPSFESRAEALKELRGRGYKIGHTKFYKDCNHGICKIEADGSILESSLNKYIKHPRSNLKRLDKIQEERVAQEKTATEVEKLKEQVAKLRFERGIMEGRYISREDFEVELAAVIGQVQTGLHHMLEMRVPDWVVLVAGDPDKGKDLLDATKRALDDRFNDLAKIDRFKVVFENQITKEGGG